MRLSAPILTAAAFAFAAVFALLMALFVASALESRSNRHVKRALVANGLDWVQTDADGLLVTLTGTAPNEALRFRAATVAGRVIGTARVIDEMDVTPASALRAPRFSLELLRNDDGISMIGLVPGGWDSTALLDAAEGLAQEGSLANMVETADFAIPPGWVAATDFGLTALRLLPRSKISVAADRVVVNAISDSPAQKRRFENDLGRALPQDVPVDLFISAPRPVIAPFTLRFVIDEEGPRFDACAADSERAKGRILTAARLAGVPGVPACTLGLGVPSPRWSDAAEAVIAAMARLGAGSVTISDVDVTLIASPSVPQADFDKVVGELTASLPDVFSLKATLVPRPAAEGAPDLARFTATRAPEGSVQLRGLLADDRMRDAVAAFAGARFGQGNVYVATRMEESLPPGWGIRVLAALAGLAELAHGAVEVEPDRVQIRGTSGNPGARAEIARILSERLGQGASFAVDVAYDERLDPARALPGPAECLAMANGVLEERQITFAPGQTSVEGPALEIVAELAGVLADCKGIALEVGGHTDSQGRAETNLRLSQERAEAVLKALAARGADTSEMTARGYGAAEPIADNATEEGRVANRRIAFKLARAGGEGAEGPALIAVPPESASRPTPRPDDLTPDTGSAVPELEEDGAAGEPMGEAGDLEIAEDGTPVEPGPEPEPPVTDSGVAEAAAVAPPATADAPAPPEAPATPPQAAPAEPGTALPEASAPADSGADALVGRILNPDGAPPDWQDDPAPAAFRPQRRPEDLDITEGATE